MKAKIDFSLPEQMKISKETLLLLKSMLEKEPEDRITATEALNHPCFHKMLSISPLIIKPSFNARSLLDHENITKKNTPKVDMPNRIEDMSPSPLPQDRNRSPMLLRYQNNLTK
jgi:serine/threonine protein kinase